MFLHSASATSMHSRRDLVLAACLAATAGFVNSAGFLLIGSFTSHVTGNVGRLASDLAAGELNAAAAAATMVASFFGGAFVSSVAVESQFYRSRRHACAVALGLEAALLLLFMVLARLTQPSHPRLQDAEALLLCAAMGIQNGLVTRTSRSVVRSTHLTGAITDLGIEAARWFRFGRGQLGARVHLPLATGANLPERPSAHRIAMSAILVAGFMGGGIAGAVAALHLRHLTMLLPVVALLATAAFAAWPGREPAGQSGEPAP